ncbi:MAG: hypothetical protein AAGK98_03735 [Pseudomonadota bacterium]
MSASTMFSHDARGKQIVTEARCKLRSSPVRLRAKLADMTNEYFPQRRAVPDYAAATPSNDTAQTKGFQQNEGTSTEVQLNTADAPEDFTISVEQVREHLKRKGLSKSKDTVQRWCRTGELTCQKQGVFGRYFTTEASLLALEHKLLPDMIAESRSAVAATQREEQLHAALNARTYTDMPEHAPADAAARSDVQPFSQLHAAEADAKPSRGDVARLSAEVEGLRAQLQDRDKQIDFLKEEVRHGRDQRGDVVQISNRMLEALETMAIGGRLKRPQDPTDNPQQSPDPVPAVYREHPNDRV